MRQAHINMKKDFKDLSFAERICAILLLGQIERTKDMYCTVKCNNNNCKYHTELHYCALQNLVLDKEGKCLYATKEEQKEVQKKF